MRHKWTAILVVMFTTLTTTQEALKQYDAFKAQANTWATLSLWTGFLSTYESPAEPLQAHVTTCQAEQPGSQAQQPYATALAQTIRRESFNGHKRVSSNPSTRVEVSIIKDNSPGDAFEAGREALASLREVALSNENGDRETEESFEYRSELAEKVVALRELNQVDVTIHAAALQQPRAATRAQVQKNRAMKRALKLLQTRFDKAQRQELSRAKGEIAFELPDGMNIALGTEGGRPYRLAPGLPLAPPQPVILPAVITGSSGCAGE